MSPFLFMLCLLSKTHSLPLYLCMNLSCHFVSCLTAVVPLLTHWAIVLFHLLLENLSYYGTSHPYLRTIGYVFLFILSSYYYQLFVNFILAKIVCKQKIIHNFYSDFLKFKLWVVYFVCQYRRVSKTALIKAKVKASKLSQTSHYGYAH